MSYLYNDQILGASSIVAQSRGKRPYIGEASQHLCPFCKENTHMLEHIWLEKTTSKGDTIRIVNNKYPITGDNLGGYHDVIIDTQEHTKQLDMFDLEHWEILLATIQERYNRLSAIETIKVIQLFKNNGRRAGASIDHSHWQMVALEQIPFTLEEKYIRIEQYYKQQGCYICEQQRKNKLGETVVDTGCWQIMMPHAATFSYEVWLVPTRHFGDLGQMRQGELMNLAQVMSYVTKAYEKLLPDVHYNICVMSGPTMTDTSYHFYIKITPRMGQIAGFELTTGCYIRTVDTKDYAKQLKVLLQDLNRNNK